MSFMRMVILRLRSPAVSPGGNFMAFLPLVSVLKPPLQLRCRVCSRMPPSAVRLSTARSGLPLQNEGCNAGGSTCLPYFLLGAGWIRDKVLGQSEGKEVKGVSVPDRWPNP